MEPWGEVRSDLAIGLVSATIANVNRSQHSRPFSAMDFCPYLKPREEAVEMPPDQFVKAIKNG